jgi:hypothetical protein
MRLETRDDLEKALRFPEWSAGRLSKAIDVRGWAGLTVKEQGMYLHLLRCEVRRGGGKVVRMAGTPAVWTASDDRLHGGCRWPEW